MAQEDFFVSPQPSGLNLREEVNASFAALASLSAGATAPTTTYADQFYFNLATGLLWKRTSANDAWARAPLIPAPVATTAAMSALDGASYPAGTVVLCLANATAGDGAGGWFEVRASSAPVDGGNVFAHDAGGALRWHRITPISGSGSGLLGAVYASAYGATGDGVTDDTAALQAALDGGAKEVWLTPGTYRVTASLVPGVSQTIKGVGGAEAVIISGEGIAGGIIEPRSIFGSGFTQRVRIADLTITAATACGYGIRLINCPHSVIERVRLNFGADANVTKCTNDAVYLGDSWGCMLYKMSVYIETATTTPARSMVNLDGGANTTQIIGGEYTGASLYGVWLHNSGVGIGTEVPTAVTAYGAIIQRAQIGIYSQRSRGCVFTGCYLEGCQTPIQSGADASSSDRSTSLTVHGGICTAMDGTGYGYGDNATAAIVARRDYNGTFSGINFNEWGSVTPENILEVYKAYGTTLFNCSRHNFALNDMRAGITFASGWDITSSWRLIGNGDKGSQHVQDGFATEYGTAAPASGAYGVGDRVWNKAPAAGGVMGWVCVTAGSPGTWKTFGQVSA